jgi:hypothetical protein
MSSDDNSDAERARLNLPYFVGLAIIGVACTIIFVATDDYWFVLIAVIGVLSSGTAIWKAMRAIRRAR